MDEKIREFVNYVFEFYKPNGIYGETFKHKLDVESIYFATAIRLQNRDITFSGDSLDREIVRDILLMLYFGTPVEELEHKDILKNFEI